MVYSQLPVGSQPIPEDPLLLVLCFAMIVMGFGIGLYFLIRSMRANTQAISAQVMEALSEIRERDENETRAQHAQVTPEKQEQEPPPPVADLIARMDAIELRFGELHDYVKRTYAKTAQERRRIERATGMDDDDDDEESQVALNQTPPQVAPQADPEQDDLEWVRQQIRARGETPIGG